MNSDHFRFRHLLPSDKNELKLIHEELFPLRYLDSFYEDACHGKGPNGKELISEVIVYNDGENEIIVGFILSQFVNTETCEDTGIFSYGCEAKQVCYILTLGVRTNYRREGWARRLVERLFAFSSNENQNCGAVYLHVIFYNSSAISFYERIGFHFIKEIQDFYTLPDGLYKSYVYAYYLNGYHPPTTVRFQNSIRIILKTSGRTIASCLVRLQNLSISLFRMLTRRSHQVSHDFGGLSVTITPVSNHHNSPHSSQDRDSSNSNPKPNKLGLVMAGGSNNCTTSNIISNNSSIGDNNSFLKVL